VHFFMGCSKIICTCTLYNLSQGDPVFVPINRDHRVRTDSAGSESLSESEDGSGV